MINFTHLIITKIFALLVMRFTGNDNRYKKKYKELQVIQIVTWDVRN